MTKQMIDQDRIEKMIAVIQKAESCPDIDNTRIPYVKNQLIFYAYTGDLHVMNEEGIILTDLDSVDNYLCSLLSRCAECLIKNMILALLLEGFNPEN